MSTIVKPNTFSSGSVIVASQHNSNFDTIYDDYNGGITNANLSASAAIADTKLAQLSTAGKIATTALPLKMNLCAGTTGTTLTIASGAVTATRSYHLIDTEASASTDDLDTINGGAEGMILIVRAASSARDVVLTEAGNLKLCIGKATLDNVQDTVTLIHDGTNWLELSRSDNGD